MMLMHFSLLCQTMKMNFFVIKNHLRKKSKELFPFDKWEWDKHLVKRLEEPFFFSKVIHFCFLMLYSFTGSMIFCFLKHSRIKNNFWIILKKCVKMFWKTEQIQMKTLVFFLTFLCAKKNFAQKNYWITNYSITSFDKITTLPITVLPASTKLLHYQLPHYFFVENYSITNYHITIFNKITVLPITTLLFCWFTKTYVFERKANHYREKIHKNVCFWEKSQSL